MQIQLMGDRQTNRVSTFDCTHLQNSCSNLRVFGTLQRPVALNMPVDVTFIKWWIRSGTTWWKATTCFSVIKTKRLPWAFVASPVQSKHYEKNRLHKLIVSFKDKMFDASAILLQNAFQTTSPLTDACETSHNALLHIKSSTSAMFAAVWADRVSHSSFRLSIHSCCRLYSVTVQTRSAQHLTHSSHQNRNPDYRLPAGGATLCYKFD